MQAPWKTCSDQWAQDLYKMQEEYEAQMQRENTRKRVRDGITEMIENDTLFLRLLLNEAAERLK